MLDKTVDLIKCNIFNLEHDQRYRYFLHDLYCADDCQIVAVNLADFENFSAYCFGDAVENGHLLWAKVNFEETPVDALYSCIDAINTLK